MCLLIMLAQTDPEYPLIVGANRDELLDRPARPMTVLRPAHPRVLGGLDELAGGTWLAVNDAGVVAGLTNRPLQGQRDPDKRSRGELPLALATHTSAESAVEAFVRQFDPHDYNPAWLLVGDRTHQYAVDMTGDQATVELLPPGIHVLENHPIGETSPKSAHVRRLLGDADQLPLDALTARLRTVLTDHEVPSGYDDAVEPALVRAKAACVHTERFGTRWSALIVVPAGEEQPPAIHYTDGPPCQHCPIDAGRLWHDQR